MKSSLFMKEELGISYLIINRSTTVERSFHDYGKGSPQSWKTFSIIVE